MKLNKRTLNKIVSLCDKNIKKELESGKITNPHDSMWMTLSNAANQIVIVLTAMEYGK